MQDTAVKSGLAALCAGVGACFLLYVLYLQLLAPVPAPPLVDQPETFESFRARRRAEADPMPDGVTHQRIGNIARCAIGNG